MSKPYFTAARQITFLRKRWLTLVIFVIASIAAMQIIVNYFVHNIPEVTLAQKFLVHSPAISEKFGDIKEVRYTRKGGGVKYAPGEVDGSYDFMIFGSKKNNLVRVYWTSQGDGLDFNVISFKIISED